MKRYFNIILWGTLVLLSACKLLAERPKPKPDWVNNRPINSLYYIGIGIAAKDGNTASYQQIAKKNALDDLISEIKVTVSANSLLSQFQNNNTFVQKFESETKMNALNTIENFELLDSWENKDYYYVYYRLSKEEYQETRNRKLKLALDIANDLLARAESLSGTETYIQAFKLRLKALVAIQDYMNDDVQSRYAGQTTTLAREIISQLQEQLYQIQLAYHKSDVLENKQKLQLEPFYTWATFKQANDTSKRIPNLPLKVIGTQSVYDIFQQTQTDSKGLAIINFNDIISRARLQTVSIEFDLQQLTIQDSMNSALLQVLTTLDLPRTSIQFTNKPIVVYFTSNELNNSAASDLHILEKTLRSKLIEDGCEFSNSPSEATFKIMLQANAKSLGQIYKSTFASSLDMNISVTDAKTGNEIYHYILTDIKGYQNSPENAGIEAYKNTSTKLLSEGYSKLIKALNTK